PGERCHSAWRSFERFHTVHNVTASERYQNRHKSSAQVWHRSAFPPVHGQGGFPAIFWPGLRSSDFPLPELPTANFACLTSSSTSAQSRCPWLDPCVRPCQATARLRAEANRVSLEAPPY